MFMIYKCVSLALLHPLLSELLYFAAASARMLLCAAMYCPHVFADILGREIAWDARAAVEGQIADMLPVYGERFTLVQMRKMAAFYLRGRRGSSAIRARLFACDSLAALSDCLNEAFAGG